MSYLERITFNPEQCRGDLHPRYAYSLKRRARISWQQAPRDEILQDYPDLIPVDIKACLQTPLAN